MKPRNPNQKRVRTNAAKNHQKTKQFPKSQRPSPRPANRKIKSKSAVQMPLSPAAQRLRQKKIRGQMRRRRQRRRILMLITAMALIVAGVVVCCKLLFQVNGVRIEIGEEKFHYVLPQLEQNSSSSTDLPNDSSSSVDSTTSSDAASSDAVTDILSEDTPPVEPPSNAPPPEPNPEGIQTTAFTRERDAEPAPPDSEPAPAETPQPSESPKPSSSPEIMRQGAKEVPLTQPIAQTTYTVGDIVELLQVKTGDNLLYIDLKQLVQKVEQQCPYLENVKVSYKLPNTILVKADIAQPKYYLVLEQGYAILSSNKKVLEIAEQPPERKVSLKLGKVTAEIGSFLRFEPDPEPVDEAAILGQTTLSEEERIKALKQAKEQADLEAESKAEARSKNLDLILQMLEKWNLTEDVTEIDISDKMELHFWYQGRIQVKLGTENQLDYKIQFAEEILKKQLSVSDRGELDVSYIREDGELRPVFSRKVF